MHFSLRVNPLNNEIEYTIADFDCIRELSRFPNCYNDLIEGNKDNLKTALLEVFAIFRYRRKTGGIQDTRKQF